MKVLDESGISKHEETLLGNLESEPGVQTLIRAFFAFHKLMKCNEEIKDNVSGELSRLRRHISDYLQTYCSNFPSFLRPWCSVTSLRRLMNKILELSALNILLRRIKC